VPREEELRLGLNGVPEMAINATYVLAILAATARMLAIGILHALRVVSLLAFFAAAWWLAMRHHDDYDFLACAKTIVPFWVAMIVSRLLPDAVRRSWAPPCAS
jgi:hypothetical protein